MSRGLPLNVKLCLDKALDSALLSVETYNKPAVKFKSGGYIVLMCIAWTSLFHAIFFKRGIKPFYREKNKVRFKRVDGEIQFWELATCVKEYFKGEDCAIRKNIELFIPLRNKLEHKFLPELDANIFAECQALLLNFDKIVEKEFGEDYCLRESLSFALQLFPSSRTLAMGIKMSKDAQKITRFIDKYRASISTDIMQSGEYSFKAFLIQVVNKGTLKPATVIQQVQERLGNPKIIRGKKQVNKFNSDTHTRCWKKYEVRPERNSDNPEKTKPEYCLYDEPNNSYLYTEKWVEFLVKKMQDDDEYQSLFK